MLSQDEPAQNTTVPISGWHTLCQHLHLHLRISTSKRFLTCWEKMISFGVNTAIFISTVRFSNIWYKSTRMRDLEQQNTFSSQQRGNWDENRGCVLAASVVSSLPFQAEVGIAPKDDSRTRTQIPNQRGQPHLSFQTRFGHWNSSTPRLSQ